MKNAREILCNTWDYEASASLYKQMVIPLAKNLFGEHFDNVGMAQVLLNHSRVQLELWSKKVHTMKHLVHRESTENIKGALKMHLMRINF